MVSVISAIFRPQIGYYNSVEEEAAAVMESLGNKHGFLDGNKRIAFIAADVFLRHNGFYIQVEALKDMRSFMSQWTGTSSDFPKYSTGYARI